MRAARLVAPNRIECVEAPRPDVRHGEVIVKTLAATICGSDLHTLGAGLGVAEYPCRSGYPGHEAVGRVITSRSDHVAEGALVLLVPDGSCNAAFADFQCVPSRFVVPLAESADPMAMVAAQQLGTVLFAMRRFWPIGAPGTATVLGAGPAGLMFIEVLKWVGCQHVIVSELQPFRRREALVRGADLVVDATGASVVQATMEATDGRGADLVVEAAGHDATRAEAVRCVAVNGTIGLFGLPERGGDAPLPLETMFLRRPTIHVSNVAQHEPGLASFRKAVELIDTKAIGVSLVSHTQSIEEVSAAFKIAADRGDGVLKVALMWPD